MDAARSATAGQCGWRRLASISPTISIASWKSDRDTICAIVGGIVGVSCEPSTIPEEWTAQQEPLPEDVRALFA